MAASYRTETSYIAAQEYVKSLGGSTILVTGATGMVGNCLVDVIMKYNASADCPIYIIASGRSEKRARERMADYWERDTFSFVEADMNRKLPECGKVDYVIHAASNTHPAQYASDPIGTIDTNVFGTKNLLEYAVTHGAKRFCFLSSVEVYGENRGDIDGFDEKYLGFLDCNTVRSGYPESKRLGEAMCNAYAQMYGEKTGFSFVVPRLSRIYGPTMLLSDSKAIAQFIKNAAAGEDIVLKSEGKQIYSYTFVTDAVAAILMLLTKGTAGEAYNVADRKSEIKLRELAEMLADISGTKVVFELPDENEKRGYSMLMKSVLNSDKLEELGWRARVHMEDGLKCCVEELKNGRL